MASTHAGNFQPLLFTVHLIRFHKGLWISKNVISEICGVHTTSWRTQLLELGQNSICSTFGFSFFNWTCALLLPNITLWVLHANITSYTIRNSALSPSAEIKSQPAPRTYSSKAFKSEIRKPGVQSWWFGAPSILHPVRITQPSSVINIFAVSNPCIISSVATMSIRSLYPTCSESLSWGWIPRHFRLEG